MQDYFKNLGVFKVIKNDNLIQITIPLAININYNLLKLNIAIDSNGYTICDDGKTFKNLNNSANFYYNLFIKNSNQHFDIQLRDNKLIKQYPDNFNIQVAINEFVRFFVYLDDYIIDNNII